MELVTALINITIKLNNYIVPMAQRRSAVMSYAHYINISKLVNTKSFHSNTSDSFSPNWNLNTFQTQTKSSFIKLSANPNGFVQFNPWNLPEFMHLPPLPALRKSEKTLSKFYWGIQLHQNRLKNKDLW